MTTTAIFRDFQQADFWRNKYRRGSEIEIRDANLRHGDIRPFACPELVCDDVQELHTLYSLPDCECHGFTEITDAVRGFCAEQHFYLDNGILRQATESELCSGANPCRAGAPYSQSAPSVSASCNDACDGVGVSYVITYVTQHAGIQVESAPSPASPIVPSNGDKPGVFVSWGSAPSGYCVVETRLYRVESTFEDGQDSIQAQGAEFVLVRSFSGGGGGSFNDNISSSDTGYPLTTYEPMAFPAPNDLVGLARTADGIAVASKNRLYISVPGQPQFTFNSVVEIEDEIIAIRAINNTIFIWTDNKPVRVGYRISSGAPSIDRQVVERRLPLKSIKSLSTYNGRIYFASEYGLYHWDLSGYGSDIRAVSSPSLITPEQWKNLNPESIVGVAYEFGYMFSSDAVDHSFMIEFGQDGTDTAVQTHIMPITYINPDVMGLDYDGHIIYRSGTDVYRWDYRMSDCGQFDIADHVIPPACKTVKCCPWYAKLYIDNEGKNRFSKMRVEFDERYGPINLTFSLERFGAKAEIAAELEVIRVRGFSLPKFCSSQTFCAELTGCSIMHEVRFATSNQELVNSSNNQVAG